ncbi:MAG: phosphonate C-P lyase system protein PhnH [Hyphomicrobiales bacterium]|nr:phosphonate C-P lyase system protein PhnH [Hyphomicrobiales bacterium]MBV8823420.1 phosphonate C-P lyase system protein PhnH [Hyphomicrobiales bacterium]MBV9426203.1 phosphonate C-P lyase system protein PhnH [Bradyrhizobiaceae bacterium]
MNAVAPGFAEPVLAAQATFRTVMEAMARPGTIRRLAGVDAPAPLSPAAAAIALTLLDYETPFWLDAPLAASGEVARFISFHTGARVTADPADAAFAFVAAPAAAPPFTSFAQGSAEYPDRSTTLVLQVADLADGDGMVLRGPGIAGTRQLAASPLPANFLEQLADNRAQFPRGIDILLAASDAVAGMPRSLHVAGG